LFSALFVLFSTLFVLFLALFVKSGDVIVMTGESRLAYHAVPCIVKVGNDEEPPDCLKWDEHANGDNMPLLKQTKEKCEKETDCCSVCRIFYNSNIIAERLGNFSTNAEEWRPFSSYLATTRININVRQVHAQHEDVKLHLT
jgi:alkylated DNA repair protein alkB family protein 1